MLQLKSLLMALVALLSISQLMPAQYVATTTPGGQREEVRDGWTIKDPSGREVKVEGGRASVRWEGNGDADPNPETKTITLPANAKIVEVDSNCKKLTVKGDGIDVDNDMEKAEVNIKGDDTKLKIDKKGTYTTEGKNQEITVQGSSAGEYTGDFSGSGSVTTNGSSSGTYTTNGGPWVNK